MNSFESEVPSDRRGNSFIFVDVSVFALFCEIQKICISKFIEACLNVG